ncbi:MAG: hypothetical protein ABGX25_07315 [Nautiliaceae bacterium]
MKEKFLMYMEELKKHRKVLQNQLEKIEAIYGEKINEDVIRDLIEFNVEILDSIAYRFAKFQDTLGKTIKVWFSLKGESVDSLTVIDVINFAEKVGFSVSKEVWWKLRNIRNKLTYEYEHEYIKVADAVMEIKELFPRLNKLLKELEERT